MTTVASGAQHEHETLEAEAKKAWSAFDRQRELVAAEGWPDDHAEVKKLDRLHDRYQAVCDAADASRDRFLEHAGALPAGRSQGVSHGLTEPGEWLASVVRNRPLAASGPGGETVLADVGTIQNLAFVDRLAKQSAIFAAPIPVLDIGVSSIRVPTVTGRLDAGAPVAELEELDESPLPLELKEITPPKFGKLAVLSNEAVADAAPATMAGAERELTRAIGFDVDRASFHGPPGSAAVGLENTVGVSVISAELTDLDWVVRARGTLQRVDGEPDCIFMSPGDFEELSLVRDRAGSNVPLVSEAANPSTSAAQQTLLGITVYVSSAIDDGVSFVCQSGGLLVVRRSPIEVAVHPNYRFAESATGIRTILRACVHVAQPNCVVLVEHGSRWPSHA